jgi:hypothetical protein
VGYRYSDIVGWGDGVWDCLWGVWRLRVVDGIWLVHRLFHIEEFNIDGACDGESWIQLHFV